MVRLQRFEGATNCTAVIILRKGAKTPKEVPYVVWSKRDRHPLEINMTYEQVLANTSRKLFVGRNIDQEDPTSPWITGSAEILDILMPVIGPSHYLARMGACFGATGVFRLEVLRSVRKDLALVRNVGGGKKHVQVRETNVESELLYPMLRGKDIGRWQHECKLAPMARKDRVLAQS